MSVCELILLKPTPLALNYSCHLKVCRGAVHNKNDYNNYNPSNGVQSLRSVITKLGNDK